LCPKTMFDAAKTPPTPIQVGDRVRFRQVTRREYIALGGEI
jgi:allophanate hydrolase subunit 1